MSHSGKVLHQLGNPSGLLGRFILWRLKAVNRGMNDLTYRALDLKSGDRVLEIGFALRCWMPGESLFLVLLSRKQHHTMQ